jgi:hypothetical protein
MQTIDVIVWCIFVGLICLRIGFYIGVYTLTRKDEEDG